MTNPGGESEVLKSQSSEATGDDFGRAELTRETHNRDNREIGNSAITSLETVDSVENDTNKLGEIVNLEMPPGAELEEPVSVREDGDKVTVSFNKKALKTGDLLDDAGVAEVQKAIEKLNQDGNVADFYEDVRGDEGMVITNLGNSYGDNAAWKKEKAA